MTLLSPLPLRKASLLMFKDNYLNLYTTDVDTTGWIHTKCGFPSMEESILDQLNEELKEKIKNDVYDMLLYEDISIVYIYQELKKCVDVLLYEECPQFMYHTYLKNLRRLDTYPNLIRFLLSGK